MARGPRPTEPQEVPAADPPARVLVAEPDSLVRAAICLALGAAGHRAIGAADARALRAAVRDGSPDLVVLDAMLPDASPGPLLAELLRAAPDAPVVLTACDATVEGAVAAFNAGAWDFLAKPYEMAGLVRVTAEALATTRLRRGLAHARRAVAMERRESPVVTSSLVMLAVLDLIERVAAHDGVTVLLEGESGTGKGVLARCIHDWSERREAPFVTVTCSAIPESLLESELFGHERGAFTGATDARAGLVAAAEAGTLFLDEIGELSAGLQAKLLALIETHRYRPVGATAERHADVRIVTATNRDLVAAMRDGQLREDLYYRLRVVPIRVPPLRERAGDIPLLAQQFLDRLGTDRGGPPPSVTGRAMALLVRYPWPGNVRELRNAIERALVVATGPQLGPEDLPAELRGDAAPAPPSEAWRFSLPADGMDLHAAERAFVVQALRRTGGNRTEAGRLLGLSRDGVRYRVKKFGIGTAEVGG